MIERLRRKEGTIVLEGSELFMLNDFAIEAAL
jgi:hypothetical protein